MKFSCRSYTQSPCREEKRDPENDRLILRAKAFLVWGKGRLNGDGLRFL